MSTGTTKVYEPTNYEFVRMPNKGFVIRSFAGFRSSMKILYIGRMKKMILALLSLFLWTNISAQGISIEVNVSIVLEGTITSKKGGKLSNAPVSVYGWDKVWIVTTNDKGYYRLNLTEGGSRTFPPEGIDGQGNIIFYYSDKRYFIFPAKDLKMEDGDVDGLPVAHLDVKL